MTKKTAIIIGLCFIFVIALGSIIGVLCYQPQAGSSEDKTQEQETVYQNSDGIYDIGITESEFRQRYNRVVAENFSEQPIALTQYQPYTFNRTITYEDPFTDKLSMMVCRYADSGLIKGILLATHSTNEAEGVQTLAALTSMIAAVEPNLSPKERGELLQKLGMFSAQGHTDYRKIDTSIIHNGKKFFIRGNNGNGVVFGVMGKDILLDPAAARQNPNDDHNILIDVVNYALWLQNNGQVPRLKEDVQKQKQKVEVPDVVGMDINNAKTVLQARDFKVNVTYGAAVNVKAGLVVAQSLTGMAEEGTTVTLSVTGSASHSYVQPSRPRYPTSNAYQRPPVSGNGNERSYSNHTSPPSTAAPLPGDAVGKGR